MINLEPIPKEIQKRLFEKMRALGRQGPSTPNSSVSTETLTHDKMATRSTFIRMTSGQANAVTLMGGMLKRDGGIRGGYDDIYGSRSYPKITRDETAQDTAWELFMDEDYGGFNEDQLYDISVEGIRGTYDDKQIENKSNRPMPGIKSIDVQFKGGLKAFRDATVNWTCWNWDELTELTPHFLAHGKTVLLQWGWVYGENSIKDIPDFMTIDSVGNRFISDSAYTDYKNMVIDGNGDFDLMVGIVKNFEYTTRDDGGFDCTTTLTNIGVNIVDNPEPNMSQIPTYIKTNLSIKTPSVENFQKISNSLKDEDDKPELNDVEKNKLIGLSDNVSFKVFLRNIDSYLEEKLIFNENTQQLNAGYSDKIPGSFAWIPNEFLVYVPKHKESSEEDGTLLDEINKQMNAKIDYKITGKNASQRYLNRLDETTAKVWVTWGWFEDNIMSKFTTQISKSSNRIVNTFRSVERLLNKDGKDTNSFESVRIANHEFLETIDPSVYILPGQLYPQEKRKYENFAQTDSITLDGDSVILQRLATIVNDSNNFKRFATNNEFITVETTRYSQEDIDAGYAVSKDYANTGYGRMMYQQQIDEAEEHGDPSMLDPEIITAKIPAKPDNFGYFRNMLINLDTIREAFGVGKFAKSAEIVETVSISEGIETLLSTLNRPIQFWDFGLTTDSVDTNNVKIIDQTTSKFDFSKSVSSQRTKEDVNGDTFTDNGEDAGVFFFPIWRADSIVKRQNVTAKVPNAMALTAMYGSNLDQFSEISNIGGKYSDTGVVLMGGLNNNDDDTRLGGLVTAINSSDEEDTSWSNIGSEDYSKNKKLGKKGDNILSFLKRYASGLKKTYEDIKTGIDKELLAAKYIKEAQKIDDEFRKSFDPSKPPPLLNQLQDGDVYRIVKAIQKNVKDIKDENNPLAQLFNSEEIGLKKINEFEELLNSKFDTNVNDGTFKMKSEFIGTIKFLTSGQRGEIRDSRNSVLIPLDIELDVDGTGGIYPGNSFHSTYLPTKYKNRTVFQAFDISHKVDSSTWTTTVSGRMRSTLNKVFDGLQNFDKVNRGIVENFINKIVGIKKEGQAKKKIRIGKALEPYKDLPFLQRKKKA